MRVRETIGAIRKCFVAGLLTGGLLCGAGAAGAVQAPASMTDGVHAVLVDAFSGCQLLETWQTLNFDWSDYGSVPVSISTGGHLCDGKFTLADLESSGADTAILDTTASYWQLTSGQIQDLQTYVNEGHTLLGTDTIFQWKSRNDNNGLAPLFGLAEQSTWYIDGLGGKSPKYKLKEQDPDAPVLLRDVTNPYISSLYGRGQRPADKKWDSSVLDGARYIARTHNRGNAITVYDAPAYTGIYISSQAAFKSTPDDVQFLYNALIYPREG